MRDVFGCIFPVVQEENKAQNPPQDTNPNGIHVSSNAYYGFQPLPQQEQDKGEVYEYMEVQTNDSGIQFNNFINPEDRLSGLQAANNFMRGHENRKRRWSDDAPTPDFKKRREYDTIKQNTNIRKSSKAAYLKNSNENLLEQLLQETHGCSIYHWTRDCSL